MARYGRIAVLLGTLLTPAAWGQSFLPPEPGSSVYRDLTLAAEISVDLFEGLTMTGSAHSNGNLELAPGGLVDGTVEAHSFLAIEGSVTGAATEGAALRALPVPYDAVAGRALATRVFEESRRFGGDETVDDVVFVAGDVRFEAGLSGQGTVIATGDIVLERWSGGSTAAGSRLVLVALGRVVVEKGRSFRGILVAGGDVELEEDVVFQGTAVAHGRLTVDETVTVTYEDFQ